MSQETLRVMLLLDDALDQAVRDLEEMDDALKAVCEELTTDRVAVHSRTN